MTRINKHLIHFLSAILSISTISASALCTLSANSVELDDNEVQSMQTSEFVLPDIIDPNDEETADFVGRVYDEESDLNTFVFENSDGSHTMKVYSHPVKYEDDEGKIKDISLELAEEENGSFVTKDNIVRTVFPKNISDGIGISYNELVIDMVPEFGADVSAKKKDDSETIVYAVDELTSLEYSLTYLGFKEDIVVSEYTGQTDFDFMLYTNGLNLSGKDGTISVSDETGEVTAVLGDIIIFDANNNRSMDGSLTYSTVRENEKYVITVHVSEDYLSADTTAYPIRIDPTIEINYENSGSNGIWDVTVNSDGTQDHNGNNLYIGKTGSSVISRVLMQFPNVNLYPIHSSKNVTSARVELQDIGLENTTMTVNCYSYEKTWSPNIVSWSSIDQNYKRPLLSSNDISYSNGQNQIIQHRYRFDIKEAVKNWVNALTPDGNSLPHTFSKGSGLLFMSDDTEIGNNIKPESVKIDC